MGRGCLRRGCGWRVHASKLHAAVRWRQTSGRPVLSRSYCEIGSVWTRGGIPTRLMRSMSSMSRKLNTCIRVSSSRSDKDLRVAKRARQHLPAVYMLMDAQAVLFTIICLCLFLLLRFRTRSALTLPLPPGPSPLPFIGNMLQVPTGAQWLTYSKWASTWGKLFSFS